MQCEQMAINAYSASVYYCIFKNKLYHPHEIFVLIGKAREKGRGKLISKSNGNNNKYIRRTSIQAKDRFAAFCELQ